MRRINAITVGTQKGATMIEIMISILIFSVGLLGIASTQTLGLTNTQSALNRSYATQLSYELVDIMRLNRAVTNLGNANGNIFVGFNSTVTPGLATNGDCIDESKACDTLAMATDSLARWEERMEGTLPEGQASIDLNGDTYSLVITWIDLKTSQEQDAAAGEGRVDVNNVAADNIYRFELDFRI